MRTETAILKNLLQNEEYTRKVLPFLKTDYFTENADKTVYDKIHDFVVKYNSLPSKEALVIELTETKMNEEEFKGKNDGLELFDQNKDGIVYMRKECSECNPQYYTFMYGKLEAITPFHGGLDKMKFNITSPSEVAPSDTTDTN